MALALARVVLQAPAWVVFDDTFSSMEDETLERIIDVFTTDLTRTTIIHIGRSAQAHLPLFSRVLHLTRLPGEGAEKEQWATERVLRRRR
jgi:putative ATP-binding cassette transporter